MKNYFLIIFCLFLLTAGFAQSKNENWYNVKEYGAIGDGKTDDTEAIQKAIEEAAPKGGVIYFPAGHYISNTINAPNFVTFKGNSAWGYDGNNNGKTIVSPLNSEQPFLFNLDSAIGTRIIGITLFGRDMGNEMHGIYSKHPGDEQNIVIEDCNIHDFSGSGIRLDNVWVFAIRRCLIKSNRLSGIDGSGSYDGWVIDNQLTANGRGGIYATGFATITITANRIEWNREGGIILEAGVVNTIQIDNCTFDRNFGPGISIVEPQRPFAIAINGNIFRRNGFKQNEHPDLNCHLRLEGVKGVSFSGNSMFGGNHNRDKEIGNRPPAPGYAIVIKNLTESVIANNSLYHAALKKLIVDKGGHSNLIIESNPGSLQQPFGID
ncbi:MAG: right-handed parallel beta-helix repeat-containing protein [Cyclobacteriaceae bacterium]